MLSLIDDCWLPVRYRDGHCRRIRPADILDESILDLAFPRADFQGAGWQFLIGLLQATVAASDREEWDEIWDDGPDAEFFASQLAALAPAFQFGAEKPSFMQDMASLDGEPLPISCLLINAPGEQTLKHNKDHFVKRDSVKQMCPACAAVALFTLQINAPGGGQGHRTGLRGGGPITTLVWPLDTDMPLWRRLWLNVLTQELMPASARPADAARFPWCGATRTSEKDSCMTTPEMVHKQQVYWGMPRRIAIDFTQLSQGYCDLCGEASEQLLSRYRSRNYGMQYYGWEHPLTPYRRDRNGLNSVKGQPGGLFYKDWLGLIWQSRDDKKVEMPAAVVMQAAALLPPGVICGLNCFGFDLDKMKPRCWYQHQVPLPCVDGNKLEEFLSWLILAVKAAQDGLAELRAAIKKAGHPLSAGAVDYPFWQGTEPEFRRLITRLQQGVSRQPPDLSALPAWRSFLRRELLRRFDDMVLNKPGQQPDLRKQINARKALYQGLGKSPALCRLVLQEKH